MSTCGFCFGGSAWGVRVSTVRNGRGRVVAKRRRNGLFIACGSTMKDAFGSLSEETQGAAVIEAFCREGRVVDALKAMKEMEKRGIRTTSRSRTVRFVSSRPTPLPFRSAILGPQLRGRRNSCLSPSLPSVHFFTSQFPPSYGYTDDAVLCD